MNSVPDVGIFQMRVGPMHRQQLASLANTRCSFNLLYVFEKGTAHQNINRVLDRSTSRYLAICDDDVEFLDEFWLYKLMHILQDHESVGMVVPVEIKSEDQRDDYVRNGWSGNVVKPA